MTTLTVKYPKQEPGSENLEMYPIVTELVYEFAIERYSTFSLNIVWEIGEEEQIIASESEIEGDIAIGKYIADNYVESSEFCIQVRSGEDYLINTLVDEISEEDWKKTLKDLNEKSMSTFLNDEEISFDDICLWVKLQKCFQSNFDLVKEFSNHNMLLQWFHNLQKQKAFQNIFNKYFSKDRFWYHVGYVVKLVDDCLKELENKELESHKKYISMTCLFVNYRILVDLVKGNNECFNLEVDEEKRENLKKQFGELYCKEEYQESKKKMNDCILHLYLKECYTINDDSLCLHIEVFEDCKTTIYNLLHSIYRKFSKHLNNLQNLDAGGYITFEIQTKQKREKRSTKVAVKSSRSKNKPSSSAKEGNVLGEERIEIELKNLQNLFNSNFINQKEYENQKWLNILFDSLLLSTRLIADYCRLSDSPSLKGQKVLPDKSTSSAPWKDFLNGIHGTSIHLKVARIANFEKAEKLTLEIVFSKLKDVLDVLGILSTKQSCIKLVTCITHILSSFSRSIDIPHCITYPDSFCSRGITGGYCMDAATSTESITGPKTCAKVQILECPSLSNITK